MKINPAIVLGASLIGLMSGERNFQVTLHIVDDEGQPVAGAKAGVSFEREFTGKKSVRIDSDDGVSDVNGRMVLGGTTPRSGISYGAEKEGYYQLRGPRYLFPGATTFRLQPWNPTIEVVLKRIKNPVPMYARRMGSGLPKRDEPVGYDLEVGDWVAPFGRGRTNDMIFVGRLRESSSYDYDWELKVTFPNPGDGLQRFEPSSSLISTGIRSPYEAPEEGYVAEWNLQRSRRTAENREVTNFQERGAYFIRVRTVLDPQGKVVKAWYGKIYGDFFDMWHYLNPDGTRNMEYDTKRNLLKPPKPFDWDFETLSP